MESNERHLVPLMTLDGLGINAVATDSPVTDLPVVGLDECAGNGVVGVMCRVALQQGWVDRYVPLWYQLHQAADGHTSMFVGSSNASQRDFLKIGKRVRGHSWSDRNVIRLLLAQFIASPTVVLITENRKQDVGGLVDLLNTLVRPAIESKPFGHLSLNVLMRRHATSWEDFASKALGVLASGLHRRGYHFEEL